MTCSAHRRRDQCEDRHRDRRRLDPCRTTGEAAPAEDREAPRIGDTGRHGRGAGRRGGVRAGRLGDARRPHARARRGRDPGNTPAGDRRCQPRRSRRRPRHRADAGPRRRGRRSRTPACGPGPPQGRRAGPRRSRRPVGRAGPEAVGAHLPAVAAGVLADLATGTPPDGTTHRATVELDAGPVEIALRRRTDDG